MSFFSGRWCNGHRLEGFPPIHYYCTGHHEGFAPISVHYRHHLLPLCKLHMHALQQQGGVLSSFSSSTSQLPMLSSISLFAVNNDDDDDDKDIKYLKDNHICYGSVKYLCYIHDNDAALWDYKAFEEWHKWSDKNDRGCKVRNRPKRANVYLELLASGKIRPATKWLQSSRVTRIARDRAQAVWALGFVLILRDPIRGNKDGPSPWPRQTLP